MRYWVVFLAAMWAMASSAQACSVTEDFVRSSTYEMVERADAVVVATAVDQVSVDGEDHSSTVSFSVDFALKGQPPSNFVNEWAYLGQPTRSDPNTISEAHPEAFMGPCSRMSFEKGRSYVIFLEHDARGPGTGWAMVHHIFWRDAEDYHGPDSLWVEVLNFYIGVEAAEPDRMKAIDLLAGHLTRLERPGATSRERALAADIRDHLSSLSPWKPTAFLVEAYEALERGESPRFGIRGLEANQEGGAAQALTDAVFNTRRPPFDQEAQKAYVLRSLLNGDHPDAKPLFDRIVAVDHAPWQAGMAIRWFAENGDIKRAFDLADATSKTLSSLSRNEAASLIGDIVIAMSGDYDADPAEWTQEPYVAAHWPQLALLLHQDAKDLGILDAVPEMMLSRSIETLFTGDWRADPRISMVLAGNFVEDAETWAIAELERTLPVSDWQDASDPVWLPAGMLAVGYGEERDAALIAAYCNGGVSGRVVVMLALAEHGDFLDLMFLGWFIGDAPDRAGLDLVRAILSERHAVMTSDEEMFGRRDSDDVMDLISLIDTPLVSTNPEDRLCDGG